MRRFVLKYSWLCMLQAFCCLAGDPIRSHRLSSQTDDELLVVLQETNATRRLSAVNYLSKRYRPPNSLVIHSKYDPQNALPVEAGIPDTVVRGMFQTAMNDEEAVVRFAAIDGMRGFLARTNILPLFELLLESTNNLVRMRTAENLVELTKQQREFLLPLLVDTIRDYLTRNEPPDVLVRALKCAGRLGKDVKVLTPQIAALSRHKSRDVRSEVRKALRQID